MPHATILTARQNRVNEALALLALKQVSVHRQHRQRSDNPSSVTGLQPLPEETAAKGSGELESSVMREGGVTHTEIDGFVSGQRSCHSGVQSSRVTPLSPT